MSMSSGVQVDLAGERRTARHVAVFPHQRGRTVAATAISETATPVRKLLLISYHFPPDASVGAIRPAKFAKYLSRSGWQPYVLTVREKHVPSQDPTRLRDVAQLRIFRTSVWPTVLQLALKLKRRLQTRTRSGASGERADGNQTKKVSAVKRCLYSLLELPDQQVGWLPAAVWAAYRLVKSEGIELVITSSPPRTTALVGLLLSYLTPIRLVTDLRDPWFTPYAREPWFTSLINVAESRSAVADSIQQWLERKIVERSVRVITTTERHALALRKAYDRLPADRVTTISNGYDAEDVAGMNGVRSSSKFVLSYLGTFYLYRSPRPVFEALGELMRQRKLSPRDLQVNLIGDVRSTLEGSLDTLIAQCGLTGCVRVGAPVSYTESLRQMMQSDLLLLFAPHQYCSIPGKAFEYLATRKPILCLAQDGATADLIAETGAGVVVPPDDVGAIKAAIEKHLDAFRKGPPLINKRDVSRYERKALSAQLSGLLIETLGPCRASSF